MLTMLRRVGDVDVDIMFCYEKKTQQSTSGLSITQFYATNDVIICLRLKLGHVHERLHNSLSWEPMTIYNSDLGRETAQ